MNAVAKIDPANAPLSTVVRGMQSQFALALPEHVSPERFVRVVVTAIQSNPSLQNADRDSVLGAAIKCAQDGLLPDGREAALVVYGSKAQYLPMIAGVLAKVRRSGELLTIASHIVYEKDAFTYTLGDDERIEHQPFLSGPRGKPIAAYAVAKTKDGGIYREVMSIEQIEQVRNVSRAKGAGPWVQWWDEMARKTVLRRLAKRLPMSTDLQQVFQRDDDHYDIRAAEGQAKLRRLHADFDEPDQTPAAPAEIIHDAVIEAVADTPADDGLPVREDTADDFPGDTEAAPDQPANLVPDLSGMKTGADLLAEKDAAPKASLAERVAKFKASCAGAGSTKLMDAWRKSSVLRTDLDASDPEEVAALTDWWQAAFDAAETAEKGGA
jgi:recombination protein RecT